MDHTLPGMFTAVAATITAIGGLVVGLGQIGLLGGSGHAGTSPPADSHNGPAYQAHDRNAGFCEVVRVAHHFVRMEDVRLIGMDRSMFDGKEDAPAEVVSLERRPNMVIQAGLV